MYLSIQEHLMEKAVNVKLHILPLCSFYVKVSPKFNETSLEYLKRIHNKFWFITL